MAVEFLDEAPNGGVEFLDEDPSPRALAALTPEQLFSARYTAEQQRPAIDKALQLPGQGVGIIGDLIKMAVKGVRGGGELLGQTSAQPLAGTGNIAQTSLEIIPRLSYQIANAIRRGASFAKDRPEVLLPLIGPALSLRSRTPTTEDVSAAFQRELANQAFQEIGSEPIAPEIFGEANLPASEAVPLLFGASGPARAAVKAAASPIQTTKALARGALGAVSPAAAARTLPATVEQSAMAALDLTKEEVARHIPVVNQRVSELFKTAPKTSEEAIKFASTAENSLYQDALAADKLATKQGLAPRSDIILEKVRETVDGIPTLLPEERAALLRDAAERYRVSTPEEGRALQKRLNKEFEAQYANDTFDRAAPLNEVKLSVRNSIAEQMDEINKAVTGVDASPYSDIGSLIEFKGNLGKTLTRIEGREAAVKTGIESTRGSKVPITKYQAAYQVKKSLLSPFQKTQLEKLNENVSRIFKEGEKAGEAAALDPVIQQQLIQKYSNVGATPVTSPASQMPPPLPVAPATSSISLEALIEDKIKSYPKKLRDDKALARIAAKQELGIE